MHIRLRIPRRKHLRLYDSQPHRQPADSNCLENMVGHTKYIFVILVVFGFVYQAAGIVDDDRNVLGLNFPYGRGLDSDLQLARLLLMPNRLCHPKRNSELINSLLGLPKNMNSAGK